MATINPEAIEQIKVVEFVKQCTDLPVIHIANERITSAYAGAILKRMGVRAGCADLFFPRQPALWIELKTKKGKLSLLQKEFLDEMRKEGYTAEVCYGADEAIKFIKSHYCFT